MAEYILGLSALYHDSAAVLLRDGEIVAAAQEERFTRVKADERLPVKALNYCLYEAGITVKDLDRVIYYDKPLLTFDRILETYLAFAPKGFKSFRMAMEAWLGGKLHLPRLIDEALGGEYEGSIDFCLHHLSHAASAFYPSPFESAAVLTVDGVGEWRTTTVGVGRGKDLELTHEVRFPHSLGLLYSAFTYYLGFKVNSGEYKVMGLAPYGEPKYYDPIVRHLIDVREDGSFRMAMRYFNYCTGLTMTNPAFNELFGGPPRASDSELTQRHMDIAASIQKVINEIMIRLARHAKKLTGEDNLCMAGGVALNCVANGLIIKEGIFKNVFVQPAAGDAGGALGAALTAHHQILGRPRVPVPGDSMKGAYLGPSFNRNEVLLALKDAGVRYTEMEEIGIRETLCDLLAGGKVVGLFRGRMEFGPRALGARTILGDPRRREMQRRMNVKIKFRESFRPFAPAVREEDASDYFDIVQPDPYMLVVAPVSEKHRKPLSESDAAVTGLESLKIDRSDIPAVTHVDYSARVQTVSSEKNHFFHALLTSFKKKTGCAVLVNTSFNIRSEPIVCTPRDAIHCFMNTGMDVLALEDFLLLKEEQTAPINPDDYVKKFVPD